MKIASVADVKAHFSAFLKQSAKGPVIVTRNGRPVAVLLAVQDEDEVEGLILAHSPRLRAILESARQQIRDGEGIPHKEFWQDTAATRPRRGKGKARRKPA
jgi:prevent-host-death family protein